MKKLSCWSFSHFVLQSVMIGLVLSAAGVARADYLYTFTTTTSPFTGSAQFSENSILTASTTITTFSSNTISGLASLSIAPESGEDCSLFFGPCIATNFSTFTVPYFFSSNLTSTGTYSTEPFSNTGTLDVSQASAAPEPSAFLLTGIGLLVGLWVARKHVFGRAARC
ncbi:MAG TPA: PEP-CTERM sorting domain-containing protein [Terriglobia bacterium]|nr:PEP-CTERM sorting domain-containing protein [Terriglobia bacterium]